MKNKTKIGDTMRETIRYFIIRYSMEHGYPPTTREIGDGVGLQSTSSVNGYLKKMKQDGMIAFIDGAPRTITVPGYGYRKIGEGRDGNE